MYTLTYEDCQSIYKLKITTYLTPYKMCLKNIKIVFNRKKESQARCFQVDGEHGLLALSINERRFMLFHMYVFSFSIYITLHKCDYEIYWHCSLFLTV